MRLLEILFSISHPYARYKIVSHPNSFAKEQTCHYLVDVRISSGCFRFVNLFGCVIFMNAMCLPRDTEMSE